MTAEEYVMVRKLTDSVNNLDKDIEDLSVANIVNNKMTESINKKFEDIEKGFKDIKKINRKRVCIKSVRVFGRILRFICPSIIAVGVSFGSLAVAGDIPFYKQDVRTPMHYELSVDNSGNESVNNWYEYDAQLSATINIYSKWELKDDGKYHRTVGNYSMVFPYEKIKEFVKSEEAVRKQFGSPRNTEEVQDVVSEEELNRGAYILGVYRYDDYTDCVMLEQDDYHNNVLSGLFVFLLVIYNAMFYFFRYETGYSFREKLAEELYEKNRKIYLSPDIKKQFKEKRKEYERIKKGNNNPVDIDDLLDKKKIYKRG